MRQYSEKRNALKHHKIGFSRYNFFLSYLGIFPFQSACMSCKITGKSRASIRGKLYHCQTYMRHFSHRRKYTACSPRDSFAYSESPHDSYPQFPRSLLGTRGLQARSHRQKKTTAFLESRSAKASSTKNNERFLFDTTYLISTTI